MRGQYPASRDPVKRESRSCVTKDALSVGAACDRNGLRHAPAWQLQAQRQLPIALAGRLAGSREPFAQQVIVIGLPVLRFRIPRR